MALATLPVKVRYYYFVDPETGDTPWSEGGYHRDGWWTTVNPEVVIGTMNLIVNEIFSQAGIEFVIESIIEEASAALIDFPQGYLDSFQGDYLDRRWRRWPDVISVYIVRYWDSGAIALLAHYRWQEGPRWYEARAVLTQSYLWKKLDYDVDPVTMSGMVLAHELGHMLGLCHTFFWGHDEKGNGPPRQNEAVLKGTLAPFPNDIPDINTFAEDRNLMDYGWIHEIFDKTIYGATVPESGVSHTDLLLTASQVARARLTLFQRRSPFNTWYSCVDLIGMYGLPDPGHGYAGMTPNDLIAAGLNEPPATEAFLDTLHAAWMG